MKMEQIINIPINKIKPNANQPRKNFNADELKQLIESMKVNGQLTPITVSKTDNGWEIVSGERRWKAAKALKYKTIKAIEKEYSDEKSKKIESIVENIIKEDLKEEDKYKFFKSIMDTENITTLGELSKKTGVSSTTLRNLFEVYETRMSLDGELKTKASSSVIFETLKLPKEEREAVIKYATKKEIGGRPVREFVKKLTSIDKEDVKKAIFEEDITIEQAERITKLKNSNEREKAIQEHKNIKIVDKMVERNIENKLTNKEKREMDKKLIQAKQMINTFRYSVSDCYSSIEKSLNILKTIIPLIGYMDEKERDAFYIQLNRMNEILERGNQITEQVEDKLETWNK